MLFYSHWSLDKTEPEISYSGKFKWNFFCSVQPVCQTKACTVWSVNDVPPETCRSGFPLDLYKNIPNLNVFPVNIQSILQEISRNGFMVVSLAGFLVGHRLYIIDGPNGRPERVHYWRWRGVKSGYSVTHKAGGKTLISGGHKFDPVTLHISLKLRVKS